MDRWMIFGLDLFCNLSEFRQLGILSWVKTRLGKLGRKRSNWFKNMEEGGLNMAFNLDFTTWYPYGQSGNWKVTQDRENYINIHTYLVYINTYLIYHNIRICTYCILF